MLKLSLIICCIGVSALLFSGCSNSCCTKDNCVCNCCEKCNCADKECTCGCKDCKCICAKNCTDGVCHPTK